jgi:hypothetical protein
VENLSLRQKLALAKQLNLIVRAINDYQLSNWDKRNDPLFNDLMQNEKDFLFLVEYLLDNTTEIITEEPIYMVIDCENFSEDLRVRLKKCKLIQAVDLISRSIIIISTVLGFNQFVQNISRREIFNIYSS